jgi:hypothetical protein
MLGFLKMTENLTPICLGQETGSSAFSTLVRTENLPFTVRLAASRADFEGAAAVRVAAYSRHDYIDTVADAVGSLNELDDCAGLLVAEDKQTGAIVGTIRVGSSLRGPTALPDGFCLDELAGAPFAYVDRYATVPGRMGIQAAVALAKAQWFVSLAEGAEWVLAAALPTLARRYRMMGMRTIAGGEEGVRLPELHYRMYEALGEQLSKIAPSIRAGSPSFFDYCLWAYHPDILLPAPQVLDSLREEELARQAVATTSQTSEKLAA